jgi:hypothetical protein
MPAKKRARTNCSAALEEAAEDGEGESNRPKNTPRGQFRPILISNLITAALLLLFAFIAHQLDLLSWSGNAATSPEDDDLARRLVLSERRLERLELAATDLGALRDEVADAMLIDGPLLAPADLNFDLAPDPDPDPRSSAPGSQPPGIGEPALPAEITAQIMVPLLMIKERNRLTAYADSAIASGDRRSYERLLEAFDDPSLAYLGEAARAEALRVYRFFFEGSRLRFYLIHPAAIFSDQQVKSEEELDRHHLISILSDLSLPWEDRTKAALLLGEHPELDALDALVDSVRDDPVLDVVREATFSFIQITGKRFELFHAAALLDWWAENRLPFAESIGADPSLPAQPVAPDHDLEAPTTPAPAPTPTPAAGEE